jgi:endo-1,4-beta-D-glucanase Y
MFDLTRVLNKAKAVLARLKKPQGETGKAKTVNTSPPGTTVFLPIVVKPGGSNCYPTLNWPQINNELTELYGLLKLRYLRTSPTGPGLRVVRTYVPDITSEGNAYMLLAAAYMNDRTTFDAVLTFVKRFLNGNGLQMWNLSVTDVVLDQNSATDAELDLALALLKAEQNWGGGQYRALAVQIINRIMQHEVEVGTFVLKPGDVFGGWHELDPSYFSPAYYPLFASVTGDSRWNSVLQKTHQIFNTVAPRFPSGLWPDWMTATGDPVATGRTYDYAYDATRIAWRLAVARAWHCNQHVLPRIKAIGNFFKTLSGPQAVVDGYKVTGVPVGQYNNAAFVGPAAVASLFLNDVTHRDKMVQHLLNMDDNHYYNDFIRFMSLLFISGKMTKPSV